MRAISAFLLGSSILLWAPASASAQGYLTAFVGGNFGADSGVSLDESIDDTPRLNLGGRLRVLGGGIFSHDVEPASAMLETAWSEGIPARAARFQVRSRDGHGRTSSAASSRSRRHSGRGSGRGRDVSRD